MYVGKTGMIEVIVFFFPNINLKNNVVFVQDEKRSNPF